MDPSKNLKEDEKEQKEEKDKPLIELGKRKRESGLDDTARDRLRSKIQELREKRHADEVNPRKFQKTSKKQQLEKKRPQKSEAQRTENLTEQLETVINNPPKQKEVLHRFILSLIGFILFSRF